jgi:hypothetical protein
MKKRCCVCGKRVWWWQHYIRAATWNTGNDSVDYWHVRCGR